MAVVLLLFILEMIRRRRLREEFAFIWLAVGLGALVLVLGYDVILVPLTHAIGAVVPTTTLFLFGMMFLALVGVTLSMHVSSLSNKVTHLTRELALLREEMDAAEDDEPRARD